MKTIAISLFLLTGCLALWARPVPDWPYDKLTREADLIVIATPVSVRDTGQKTVLPGIRQGTAGGGSEPIPAIEMETTFEVLTTLKGEVSLKPVIFCHLRLATPPRSDTGVVNGPLLVSFNPKQKKCYLLFLRRELDGRYVSVAGQTDPARAVKELSCAPTSPLSDSGWSPAQRALRFQIFSLTRFERQAQDLVRLQATCTLTNTGPETVAYIPLARLYLVNEAGVTNACQRHEDAADTAFARRSLDPGQTISWRQDGLLRTEAGNYWLFAIWDGDKGVKSPPIKIKIE